MELRHNYASFIREYQLNESINDKENRLKNSLKYVDEPIANLCLDVYPLSTEYTALFFDFIADIGKRLDNYKHNFDDAHMLVFEIPNNQCYFDVRQLNKALDLYYLKTCESFAKDREFFYKRKNA